MRRDDSSIDSLERELMHDEHHHHHVHSTSMHQLRRDKMSVTNLSRDSGLTLSDTQLYTPDEDMEEGSESSSSGRGSDRDKSRVNGGSGSSAEMLLRPRTTTAPAAVAGGSSSATSRSEQNRSLYAVPNISGIQSAPRLDAYGKLNAGPSSYTPVYNHRPEAIYRKLSDDVVYAVPKATPTVVLSEEFQSAASRFQRQDWFRRKSHNRKQSGGVKFDDSPPPGSMRRSASDESLANVNSSSMQDAHYHHMHHHMHHQSNNNKKPAIHRKGRAPAPPANGRMMMSMDCMELSRRSKSDAHLDAEALRSTGQDETDRRSSVNYSKHLHATDHHNHHHHFHHPQQINYHHHSMSSSSMRPSLSTPHISDDPSGSSSSTILADRSYDSSTLSDDDSTPHVSRSNSRGSKDYRAVNSAWESAYGALTVPVPAPIHVIVSQDGSTPSYVFSNGSTSTPSAKHQSRAQTNGSSRSSASPAQYEHRSRQVTANSVGRSSHYSATPATGGRYADYDTVVYSSSNGRNRSRETPCTSLNSSKNVTMTTPDIPSYEEAMLIRRQRQGGSANSQGTPSSSNSASGQTSWTTWKDKSSERNLIQVRASPVRLQKAVDENVVPAVPPKSDPIPPLPPKQKIHLRSNPVRLRLNNNNSSNINNNSPGMSPSTRARPVTIHMDASILSSLDSSQQQAPALPRKERQRGNNVSVVSIENSYTPLHRSFAFSTHNLRTAMMESAGRDESSSTSSWTSRDDREDDNERKDQEIQTSGHWAQFCEIETQTSLSPQPSLTPSASSSADEEILTAPSKRAPIVGRYEKNNVRSATKRREVAVETERSRARTKDSSTGREHRSHSLPPLERSPLASETEDVESDQHESVKVTTSATTKMESSTSQTPRRAEISWSVSQLRALFNGSSSSPSTTTTVIPPPYRSPPTHQQQSQQQRQRSESTDSYGEESYV